MIHTLAAIVVLWVLASVLLALFWGAVIGLGQRDWDD